MDSPKVLAFRPSLSLELPAGVSTGIPCISVGADEEILSLRGRILQRAGYSVLSMGVAQAELESQSSAARVWIFCHSLDTSTLLRLAQNVRQNSHGSKLIYVSAPEPLSTEPPGTEPLGTEPLGIEAALFHRIIEPSMGLIALLAAVREFTLPME
jgi:hypothetical protein